MNRYLTVTQRLHRAACCSAAVLLIVVRGAFAQPPGVDWKLYGGTSLNERAWCFYDATGITQMPSAHVRVWTKCLREKALDSIDIQKDFGGKILENTAQKVGSKYVPPFATVETVDADKRLTITLYEVTANIGNLDPQASIFYELDCRERMIRELSVSIQTGGKRGSSNESGDWRYVPPEGNGARLLKILCVAR